jgi:hypothetical protein
MRIQCAGSGAEALRATLLDLADHRQHVAGEGIGSRAIGRRGLYVRLNQAGAIAQRQTARLSGGKSGLGVGRDQNTRCFGESREHV